jgi:hypothetical protein
VKLLVLTSEPVSADQLRAALDRGADLEHSEVMIVAPALQESAVRFWMSDADEAITRAEWVGHESRERLQSEGVAASADTGEADPIKAVQDALQTFPADRIVVFAHPKGEQRYREDVDPHQLEIEFGLPVARAQLSPDSSA